MPQPFPAPTSHPVNTVPQLSIVHIITKMSSESIMGYDRSLGEFIDHSSTSHVTDEL
jgi:hypothetical protein